MQKNVYLQQKNEINMYLLYTLIICLLWLGSPELNARQPHYSFHQISIEEGLSQSSVQSILVDSRGSLWIGTKSGLNKYVQQELKTFLHQPENPTSIPNNLIHHIEEDSLGTIWLATANGLASYHYQGDEFTLISRNIVFSSMKIEGGMLFGGDNFILRYDYQQKNIERIYLTPEETVKNPVLYRIQRLIPWKKNKILVGTRQKGVYIFDTVTRSFTPFITTPRPLLMSLYAASDNRVYTSHYGAGLFCYDSNGKELYNCKKDNSPLTNNYILDIMEHEGNLWLATDGGGINILSLSDRKNITALQQVAGNKSSLPDNSIVKLYKDKEGNLWAGSVREGIFIIKENHIQTFKDATLNAPYGLSDKTVTSLYEEENGNVWIGTDGGGINHYSPKTNRFTHYPNTEGDKITSITAFSEEEMLVSIYTRGLSLFNKKSGTYRPFLIVDDKINAMERDYGYIPLTHKVNNEKIYILGMHAWCYHLSDKSFSPLQFADSSISPSALRLSFANDSIALMVRDNHVYMSDLKTDSVSFCFDVNKEERISAVSLDNNQRIWTGTNHSFGYYDLNKKKYHSIPTKLFSSVSYLATDPQNRLWICAQNMLFTYDLTDNKFTVWNSSDGYMPNEILFSFQKFSHSDYIYLGGTEGLVKIQTKDIKPKNISSSIELVDLNFNGLSYRKNIRNNSINIPWDYLSLSAIVQVNTQDIFQKNLIRYIIRKNGTERQYESYDNVFNLTTLAPGEYSIWASCNLKDGTFTEPVHLIDIVITPPWYKTIGFIIFLIILLIGTAYGLLKYSNHQKEKAMKEKIRQFKLQTNEEKINFLVNINHELRTPLTLIYAPLKRLAGKESKELSSPDSQKLFRIVYNQALRMKNIINMVLDMNRLESGTDNLKMQRYKLNDWVKQVTDDFENEWKEKNIQIAFQPDHRIEEVWFDEWKCQIVLSNLLMNALKFNKEGGKTSISTELRENYVRVSIADQGIGLSHLDTNKLFSRFYEGKHTRQGNGIGLSYAKMLVELHGGNINAFTNEDGGATFYFELPLNVSTPQPGITDISPSAIDMKKLPDLTIDMKQYTLLIIEDENELREYLHHTLAESFKEVYSAPNAEEGLFICREKQPSLVISDVMMPGMNGYEFCRQVKNDITISHIPVILLTARCDENSIRLGYKQGADFYMPKPFEMDFLQTIVCNLLGNRELKRHRFTTQEPIATPQEATISQRDEEFMIKLNELIRNNLETEEISVEFLTDNLAMSRASLYSKVKVLTGLGVNDYINRIRIERATELLTYTDKPIADIASEVGFTYPRYFSTLFKKIKGITPTQFKENIKKE